MAQAVQNPKLFRQLDRQEHFDALLIAGDPNQSRPLLDHLRKSGDWSLEWADAFALIFRRGGERDQLGERLKEVRLGWVGLPVQERAERLAVLGDHLVAAGRMDDARGVLDEATSVMGSLPAVLASEGRYRLERGEWAKAVAMADRGLKTDPRHRPSLSVKAQALYFSKRFQEAYQLSKQLLEDSPKDPLMLFAHAKIAHEIGGFSEEIEVLQRLIEIVEDQKRSTSSYRVFLGQAMAKTGDGDGALRELSLALRDPDLPSQEREFAEDALKRVRAKLLEDASVK
jgi:tetratricopeptide (TPR) repeat protein